MITCLSAAVNLPASPAPAPAMIQTVAGGLDPSAFYDYLSYPAGVAMDNQGNLFIADAGHNRIRKITPAGDYTTVAGNGSLGFSGDFGPAVQAALKGPQGIAVDGAGNLYIADTGNSRVRKVDSAGTITTLAGSGVCTFIGEGVPAPASSLCFPRGVTIAPDGNLYVSDTYNSRVRKITINELIPMITTVAGTGIPRFTGDGLGALETDFNGPYAVTFDAAMNMYVADTHNHRIRKVDAVTRMVSTVAGDGFVKSDGYGRYSGDSGPAVAASLNFPRSVFSAQDGSLYISDSSNHRIRKVAQGTITTVVGDGRPIFSGDGGPAHLATVSDPYGFMVRSGSLFIADSSNLRLRKVDTAGTVTTFAGTGRSLSCCRDEGKPATSAVLFIPMSSAVDRSGTLYIADTYNQRVIRVDSDGVIETVAGNGIPGFGGDGGPGRLAKLHYPQGLATDSAGNVYIADTGNNRIRRLTPSGTITTFAGDGRGFHNGDGGPATQASLFLPIGVAADGMGNVYVADTFNNRIRKIGPSGIITTVAGSAASGWSGDGGPATSAALKLPQGVAVSSGGTIFIADTANHRVRRVTTDGIITTVAGDGWTDTQDPTSPSYGSGRYGGDGQPATMASLNKPGGVAVDLLGNVFVADTFNNRIRQITVGGTMRTVVGTGRTGYAGAYVLENGVEVNVPEPAPAIATIMSFPMSVTLSLTGDLYITDTYNGRIRMVTGPYFMP